ncbi:MAG: hypothetical protein WC490_00200 [Candidatus Margulisiibacteriota bacterium]
MTEEPKFKNTEEIKLLLNGMKDIVLNILQKDSNCYFHTLLLIGMLNRTYELTESAIWAIDNSRPITAFNMLRGLFETLGYMYYSMEKLKQSSSLIKYNEETSHLLLGSKKSNSQYQATNILTCIDRATKTFTKLREQYDNISEIVHPNASSHAYCARPDDEEVKSVVFRIPAYEFKNQDKLMVTNMVGECCCNIQSLCKEILSDYDSIQCKDKR